MSNATVTSNALSASSSGSPAASGPVAGQSAASQTVGDQLKQSPAIRAAVEQILTEVRTRTATLTGEKPASAAKKESYDILMKRAADVRGRPLLYPYVGSGAGNGALVELADGSVKWDMICGIGVHFFGHSDIDLIGESLLGSIDDTVKHGNLQANFEPHAFAEVLLKEAGKNSRLKYCYLSTSGAMANENGLKVCYQKHAPASRVLAFKDCFMGRSITMCQIGDTADYRQGIPLTTLVDYMPFWNAAEAERIGKGRYIDGAVAKLNEYIARYPGQHACFIFELCQGEGGFNIGDRDFFVALMEVCRKYRIAIWDDEIQCFGRTNRMFAYELFNVGEYVDVFCVGKMTQACATLYTEEYNPRAGLLSGTFTGESSTFRVGQRVIERLRDGKFYGNDGLFAQHHAAFREQSRALMLRRPELFPSVAGLGEGFDKLVGGIGGMMRLTPFGGVKDKILKASKAIFEEGAIVFYCGHAPYHLRLLPPLPVMKLSDWPRVFAALERGLVTVGA